MFYTKKIRDIENEIVSKYVENNFEKRLLFGKILMFG